MRWLLSILVLLAFGLGNLKAADPLAQAMNAGKLRYSANDKGHYLIEVQALEDIPQAVWKQMIETPETRYLIRVNSNGPIEITTGRLNTGPNIFFLCPEGMFIGPDVVIDAGSAPAEAKPLTLDKEGNVIPPAVIQP